MLPRLTERPIFITGVPRCGSSWAGDVLSTARGVRYNYEAFNPTRHVYLTRHHVYLSANDEDALLRRAAEAAFSGRVRFHQFLRGVRWGYWWRTIRPARRVLLKDPTAMFMAEWVAKHYNAEVLIIIRHPCAFASSIHRLGWPADPSDFLTQRRLMEDWLGPYEKLIRDSVKDFWTRVGAFWGAAHVVLHGQLQRHPEWRLIVYEDLCRDPRAAYGKLFSDLALQPTRQTEQLLTTSTTTSDSHAKSTSRKSSEMPDVWKKRLRPEQSEPVMSVVRQFGLPWYAADQSVAGAKK